MVADHAEAYGSMIALYDGDASVMRSEKTKRWNKMLRAGGEVSFQAVMEMIESVSANTFPPELLDKNFIRTVWERHTAVADQYGTAGFFLVTLQPHPQILRIFTVKGRKRHDLVHLVRFVTKDHNTVQIVASRM